MPWVDADDWLAYYERKNGPTMLDTPRPLNFDNAAKLAYITGPYQYEHQIDGTTRILVEDK